MGTIEVTRLGLREADMATIAEFISRVLVENEPPEEVAKEVVDFRMPWQVMYYNFDNGLPPWAGV
jgi:glycine hydroxymethyltransferase